MAYENGEPKDIPDSEREVFKTKGGRPVLDGGGVTPDVKLDAFEPSEILQSLDENNWIFKYVNKYIKDNPGAPGMTDLSFDKYADFTSFVKKGGFTYDREVETALSNLLEKAKNSDELQSEVQAIKSKVDKDKADDLQEFKDEITKRIEIELAQRYHFQEGKAFQRLKNDPEIDEAIKLLGDPQRYKKLLQ